MKSAVPDELKSNIPQTPWGKILTMTPVVMTVVATLLAGLSSSEMTRAQYDRSLAAQQQSKAGDQWSYFQAKRLRGAMQRSTLDILQAMAQVRPFRADQFRKKLGDLTAPAARVAAAVTRTGLYALLDSREGAQTLELLQKGELPEPPPAFVPDKTVASALATLESNRPDAEMNALITQVRTDTLDDLLRSAITRTQAYDSMLKPFNRTMDEVENLLSRTASSTEASGVAGESAPFSAGRDFAAARLRYQAARYDAESRLNQAIANVYELQVRKSNLTAERHHRRSQRFFFGMLAAQAAVIIATFSMAAQKRSLLWSFAAAAGLAAIAFAIYVYFYV